MRTTGGTPHSQRSRSNRAVVDSNSPRAMPTIDMPTRANKNNHNVYILGAGFSADAGIPVVRGFLNCTRDCQDWLASEGRKEEAEAIDSILSFRLAAASAAERMHLDLENIEELFSLADASKRGALGEAMVRSIAATIEFSQLQRSRLAFPIGTRRVSVYADGAPSVPQHWISSGHGKLDSQPVQYYDIPLYDALIGKLCGFFSSPAGGTHTLISFNYDLVCETALGNLGIGYSYGFAPGAADYNIDDPRGRTGQVLLLKLHGSVNWAYPGQRGKSLTVYKSSNEPRENGAPPFIIPPTWKKSFDSPLSGIWDAAVESIASATRIVIIGYSMPTTDTHFKYLLAAGLQRNASLRRLAVIDSNPDKAAVETRLFQTIRKDLAERGMAVVHTARADSIWDDKDLGADLCRDIMPPFSIRRS